jgi:hypothetical protein
VRVRRAAAFAVAAIDAVEGANAIHKKAKGKTQVAAQEALALVLRSGQPAFAEAEKLEEAAARPERALRESAAVAWLEGAADRTDALRTLLNEPFLVGALPRARRRHRSTAPGRPDAAAAMLGGTGQNEVVGRRMLRALAAVLAAGRRRPRAGRADDAGEDRRRRARARPRARGW